MTVADSVVVIVVVTSGGKMIEVSVTIDVLEIVEVAFAVLVIVVAAVFKAFAMTSFGL